MKVEGIRTPALGDTSYLVTHGGFGMLVDPQRDIGRFLDRIEARGVTVTHVLDTHVHNDYLSGAPALARRSGADLVLPAAAGVAFGFVPAFHHEEIPAEAGLAIRPLHTPGHTPEHTSYLLVVNGRPSALFSGGSLLVGSAGRTDLLGSGPAESLARLQYGSVRRLAALPAEVGLYPTHGAGSFCTSGNAGADTSTIGGERGANPALASPDEDTFVRTQLADLLPYPRYYAHMGPLNRRGAAELDPAPPPDLGGRDLVRLVDDGAFVIDARSRQAYARGHMPGSLNVEAGESFAPWVGWVVPFGAPVVLVADQDQDATELKVELGRIGYDVAGVIGDGAGLPEVTASRLATLTDLAAVLGERTVLDVRDPQEWRQGHLRDTIHRYVPDLVDGDVPVGEVWIVCASGFRSSIAAGLVERHGGSPVVVTPGGVADLLSSRPELAAA